MLKIGKAQDGKMVVVYNRSGEEIRGIYQYEPRSRLVTLKPYWYKGKHDSGTWHKDDLFWKCPK